MRWTELVLALGLALAACTISRDYIGSELKTDPAGRIVVGVTRKAEVLALFGPPDEILRQLDGDIFVYRYARTNASTFTLEEPVVTNLEIFSYSKTQKKSDRLVVLFDREGTVSAYGFRRGTQELEPL